MMDHLPLVDNDVDGIRTLGQAAHRAISALPGERVWDGATIAEPGVYAGIRLADYHDKRDLFDGPSISKSALKWLLPVHGGSPKAFWGRWKWNPRHIEPQASEALDFGKAVHCLLLGDEVFSENFVIRPEKYPDYRTKESREWRAEVARAGLTVVTQEQVERIRRIGEDASRHPLVTLGLMSGKIERTLCFRDRETGLWVKARPDAVPTGDGVHADLKSASRLDEDFLERQAADAGYYLQAAIVRMACRALDLPFDTFVMLYVLNDDVPDTVHVELSEFEIDRGERAVRWCLRTIRRGLDTGEWPGARPFDGGERRLQLKPWFKESLDRFLDQQERDAA